MESLEATNTLNTFSNETIHRSNHTTIDNNFEKWQTKKVNIVRI